MKKQKKKAKETSNHYQSAVIPEDKRAWFYDKQGNVRYVTSSPSTIDGRTVNAKSQTHCGALHDSVGFSLGSQKPYNQNQKRKV